MTRCITSARYALVRADYRVFRLVGYGRLAAAWAAVGVAMGLRA